MRLAFPDTPFWNAFVLALPCASATLVEAARLGQTTSSDIRDTAGLFSADAIASARRELERVERETGAAALIETQGEA